jgi:hypothetical protein
MRTKRASCAGHRVFVGIKPHQRQRSCPGLDFATGIEGDFWQRQERHLVFGKQVLLAGLLTPQRADKILAALLHQPLVEFLKVPHLGHRHQELHPRELDHRLHNALFIGPAHPAEMLLEPVVALQLQKRSL